MALPLSGELVGRVGPSVLHHQLHARAVLDLLERVLLEHHEVGEPTRLQRTEVVIEAVSALEYTADHTVIGSLEKLLQHPDPEVREAAEDAIDYLEE